MPTRLQIVPTFNSFVYTLSGKVSIGGGADIAAHHTVRHVRRWGRTTDAACR